MAGSSTAAAIWGQRPRVKTLAIFGDTAPCPQALEMARGADVMVHETTLEQAMAEKANSRGHSSSQQTAALAKESGGRHANRYPL
ncbi:ribonuclease Z [Klebsiella aerogenes]|nr:ribonuclease Z [Klebsiella aerogenes]